MFNYFQFGSKADEPVESQAQNSESESKKVLLHQIDDMEVVELTSEKTPPQSPKQVEIDNKEQSIQKEVEEEDLKREESLEQKEEVDRSTKEKAQCQDASSQTDLGPEQGAVKEEKGENSGPNAELEANHPCCLSSWFLKPTRKTFIGGSILVGAFAVMLTPFVLKWVGVW